MEFRHPNYYKELRKLRNNLDQAISTDRSRDKSSVTPIERAPGPGLKLPGPRPISNANKGLIHKRQASSNKLTKSQASSSKHQAPSTKAQA